MGHIPVMDVLECTHTHMTSFLLHCVGAKRHITNNSNPWFYLLGEKGDTEHPIWGWGWSHKSSPTTPHAPFPCSFCSVHPFPHASPALYAPSLHSFTPHSLSPVPYMSYSLCPFPTFPSFYVSLPHDPPASPSPRVPPALCTQVTSHTTHSIPMWQKVWTGERHRGEHGEWACGVGGAQREGYVGEGAHGVREAQEKSAGMDAYCRRDHGGKDTLPSLHMSLPLCLPLLCTTFPPATLYHTFPCGPPHTTHPFPILSNAPLTCHMSHPGPLQSQSSCLPGPYSKMRGLFPHAEWGEPCIVLN